MAQDRSTSSTEYTDEDGVTRKQNSHTIATRDSDSVEITRGQKGTYGWTIKVYGQLGDGDLDRDALYTKLDQVDLRLHERFGTDGT